MARGGGVVRRWHTGGAQVARMRGRGHASPRRRLGGATWQGGWHLEGPRVSGPCLEYWGGNANALRPSTFYTRRFHLFLPCGTMFLWNLNVAGDVTARWASDAIVIRPSCGHGVHRIVDQDTCVKGGLSELDQCLTLRHVASRGALDLHRDQVH